LPVWVDDPLRGEYYAYDAILHNLTTTNVTSSTADVIWDVYDNGTNTTLTVYYGQTDMGNNSQLWPYSFSAGTPQVGPGSAGISFADDTTYYVRIMASNEEGEAWFGPISVTPN
jgi:hypothetical protein